MLPATSFKINVNGSVLEDGSIAAGVDLNLNDLAFNRNVKHIGDAHLAYDGEIVTILLASHLVHELNFSPDISVYIISDCQSAVKATIQRKMWYYSQARTILFDELQSTPVVTNRSCLGLLVFSP